MENSNTSKKHDFSDFYSGHNVELFPEFVLILQKWKFILFSVLFFTFLGGGYLFFTKPDIYEAKATLMVSSGQIYSIESLDNDEILRNKNLIPTYTEIARNESFIAEILEKLDLNRDPKDVLKLLKMDHVAETELIHISFRDENPQIAAAFVNEVANEFVNKIESVMTFQNLKIIDMATVPHEPRSKKLLLFTAVLSVFGFMLAIFLINLSEMLYGRIKDPKYLEEILESQVLSNIPIIKK